MCTRCDTAIPSGERYVYTAFGRWFDPGDFARRGQVVVMRHHHRCFLRDYPAEADIYLH